MPLWKGQNTARNIKINIIQAHIKYNASVELSHIYIINHPEKNNYHKNYYRKIVLVKYYLHPKKYRQVQPSKGGCIIYKLLGEVIIFIKISVKVLEGLSIILTKKVWGQNLFSDWKSDCVQSQCISAWVGCVWMIICNDYLIMSSFAIRKISQSPKII